MPKLYPGAYLLFFGGDQAVWYLSTNGLRGDHRHNHPITRLNVSNLNSSKEFRLTFKNATGAVEEVKYVAADENLQSTSVSGGGTLFMVESQGGSKYKLTFAVGGDKKVVENVVGVGLRAKPYTAAANGTVFEFVEVPASGVGDYAIITVEVTSLDPSTLKGKCSLTANPDKWEMPAGKDWIDSSGNIFTPKGKQAALIMELVSSAVAASPAFDTIFIGPSSGGPLKRPDPTIIPGAPFAVTKNSDSTQLTLTESSLDGGKIWKYELSIDVGGKTYRCDPKIYNDGTGDG